MKSTDSTYTGMAIRGNHTLVRNNTVYYNDGFGISLTDGSLFNDVIGNNCTSNGLPGIFIEESHFNDLIGNDCSGNVIAGVWLLSSNQNYIAENNCTSHWEVRPDGVGRGWSCGALGPVP